MLELPTKRTTSLTVSNPSLRLSSSIRTLESVKEASDDAGDMLASISDTSLISAIVHGQPPQDTVINVEELQETSFTERRSSEVQDLTAADTRSVQSVSSLKNKN